MLGYAGPELPITPRRITPRRPQRPYPSRTASQPRSSQRVLGAGCDPATTSSDVERSGRYRWPRTPQPHALRRPTPSGRTSTCPTPTSTRKPSRRPLGPTRQALVRPRPPTAGLDRWAARPEVPDLLPGEDRTFGPGLFVDMIPSLCWFTNVRTCVSRRTGNDSPAWFTAAPGRHAKCAAPSPTAPRAAGWRHTSVGLRRAHRRASAPPLDLPVLGLPPLHPPRLRQRHGPRRPSPRPPARRDGHDHLRGVAPRPGRQRHVDDAIPPSLDTRPAHAHRRRCHPRPARASSRPPGRRPACTARGERAAHRGSRTTGRTEPAADGASSSGPERATVTRRWAADSRPDGHHAPWLVPADY